MRACLTLCLVAGLACSTPIKGHEITDNKLNREVLALMNAYAGAMQARDADRVLALVADNYFEDGGNADTKDDYGRDELAKKLKERFENTSELHMKLTLIDVVDRGQDVAARMRFEIRYRLDLPSGSRWERHADKNEVILVRKGQALQIKSGL